MHKITEEEIDFILEDISANGVVIEDLQNNLLDHICCIIEHEMSENDNFYKFYKQIMPRFFKKELKEIQEETENLLTFKNYYAMKTTLKITGIASIFFTLCGSVLKTFHLPGAGISIVLGALIFSLIFLPLLIALKFRDEEKTVDKWILSFGFLLAIMMVTGTLFKLMHWPGANFMMIAGIVTFTFIYVPIYFFSRVKRPELKFNATVNSVLMMACGGLLFAMFDLGRFNSSPEKTNAFEYLKSSNEKLLKTTNKEDSKKIILDMKETLDSLEEKLE